MTRNPQAVWTAIRKHDKDVKTPPDSTIVMPNPAYDKWVEHVALILCLDAGECGVIPTPCGTHLTEARRFGMDCRSTFS